uniref:Ubiquitously-expressed, prefoldin-like chaperone n=1 Tax=Petromyzon marinus TaxID=7757 RepID=S4RPG2_PETMA
SQRGSKAGVRDKVTEYEAFINEVLKRDLQSELVFCKRTCIYVCVTNIYKMMYTHKVANETGCPGEELKTQVDLGCNFYVNAKVPDASHIFVSVGYGFFVEFTLPEALKFIDKKTTQMNEYSEKLTKDSAKIKANIKMVLEGLRELQGLKELPVERTKEVW